MKNDITFTSTLSKTLSEALENNNAPESIRLMIALGAKEEASDIHLEPMKSHGRVRIRIDGALHTIAIYKLDLHSSLVSRIKILANLKIDEQRKPQDGRIDIDVNNSLSLDIRVSTLPIINGEKVVMRLVNKSMHIPDLKTLGLEGYSYNRVMHALKKPNGIILNTGPTGSGKSTTLYSCLTILNQEGINILTLEDPVENQLPGLNQSQVKPEIGYTFAYGLRNALRQDPDIMMVGEIRDKETLETSIEAALTGHLVLSTLHTNSAIGTVTRLLNMEVPRYLIASTVQVIIAQRLVRLLCTQCKQDITPNPSLKNDIIETMKHVPASEIQHRLPNFDINNFTIPVVGKGCEHCNHIGYKGRIGIYEVIEFHDDFRNQLLEGDNTMVLRAQARKQGTVFLREDGMIRVLQGKTSIEEVLSKS